jgi:hypothetical protein
MANSTLVTVGSPVSLNLQLSDGEENLPLIVKAYIRDNQGVTLSPPIQLTHVGMGLFKDYSFTMPNVSELTAQYVVYESDGVTLAPYTIDADIFTKFVPSISQDVDLESLISKFTTETMEIVVE